MTEEENETFTFHFRPRFQVIGHLMGTVATSTIAEEPMLFSASVEFARSYGGPLTRSVLNLLDAPEQQTAMSLYRAANPGAHRVIDTRSHMLMPGQYPAIPGWHCDAYPRGQHSSGQPDLWSGNPKCFHYVVTISDQRDGVSNTTFLEASEVALLVRPEEVWGSVHEDLERRLREPSAADPRYGRKTWAVPDGHLLRFNQESLHRATKTHTKGWRWFFRLSMYHSAPMNQIRRQVQVYTTEGGGW